METLNKQQQEQVVSVYHFTIVTVNNICKGRFRNIIEDIWQEAHLAVCKATLSYKVEAGVAFTTYVYPHIVYAVQKSVREYGFVIRIPQHIEGLASVVHLQTTLNDEGVSIGDEILASHCDDGSDELQRKMEENEKVESLLSRLTKREQKIIRCLFGFDGKAMTMRELAKHMNISTRRLQQEYNNAMINLEKKEQRRKKNSKW